MSIHHLLSSCLPLTLSLAAVACTQVQDPVSPSEPPARATLRAAGVRAPLALHPVRLLGRADTVAAEALGLVLERQGMSDLVLAEAAFDPADAPWDHVPGLLQAHVRAQAQHADAGRYALYAQFLGDPQQGPTEVRFVVVDPTGDVALVDRQTPADRAFQRTAGRDPDPLGCAMLVGDRLFTQLQWRPVRGGVRDGQFQRRWQQKSGVPDAAEQKAIAARLRLLREGLAEASFVVLPTLWCGQADAASAARLAERLPAGLGCRAAAAGSTVLTVAPSSNEQKRLWDLARALRTALAAAPPAVDHALVVDLALHADGGRGYVHVVVADREGGIVVADFQNDQAPLFREQSPKTLREGEAMVLARLRQLLR